MSNKLTEHKLLVLQPSGEIANCLLTVQSSDVCSINLEGLSAGELKETASSLYDCLCSIRMKIEPQGFRLLCSASRIDAFSSPMLRQALAAKRVYILRMGFQARKEDLVDIFSPAAQEQVGTVTQQAVFLDKWLKSL